MAGIAWTMSVTPVLAAADASRTALDDLGLGRPARRRGPALPRSRLKSRRASPSDRRWTIAFLVSLFAIHMARIQGDGTLLGLASPAISLLGDMSLAVIFTFAIVVPIVLSVRTSTRWLEHLVWKWYSPRAMRH